MSAPGSSATNDASLAPLAGRGDELRAVLAAVMPLVERALAREGQPCDPATLDPRELRARLGLALGELPTPLHEVLAQLDAILAATPSSSSWRFVNQLFGGREPVAVAAELLASVGNVSMYTFKAAGAQVLVEDELTRHMANKLGMPTAEGSFAPGGSLANLVALLLARDAALPTARDAGMRTGAVAIYASSESHYSVPKSAAILGLGRTALRRIEVDDAGRMRVDRLQDRLLADVRAGVRPLAIVATSGTTVRAAFDPLRELSALARKHGAWLHVDGALGASFVQSRAHAHRVDGIDLADSVSWNPHKLMGVPLQSSLLLVRHRGALAASLDQAADYLFQTHAAEYDPGHRSLQCGRRNDALKLWAAWKHLGDAGWDARIERQMALARFAAERVAADPGFELLEPPAAVNVCFCVRGVDSAAVCDRLYRSGRLSIGHGQVGERRALRLVCVNPDLGEAGIERILDEIRDAVRT
ncbi:MAG: aminotransferase class V-fold PLP-dependent enzyme [Planctomycetes bacterium]|nr:aminotransferase class V-fold PLP-dependent enzyme [Planctomycetota bacterium]